MAAITALVVGAIAAASAAYQYSETQQAKKDANRIEGEQRAALEKQESDLKARQEQERQEAAAVATRNAVRSRRRVGAQPRSTVLTSPLGIPGEPNTGGKTLLGQ